MKEIPDSVLRLEEMYQALKELKLPAFYKITIETSTGDGNEALKHFTPEEFIVDRKLAHGEIFYYKGIRCVNQN